jgi:hypothetical protein
MFTSVRRAKFKKLYSVNLQRSRKKGGILNALFGGKYLIIEKELGTLDCPAREVMTLSFQIWIEMNIRYPRILESTCYPFHSLLPFFSHCLFINVSPN